VSANLTLDSRSRLGSVGDVKAGAPFITRVGLRSRAVDGYVVDIPAIASLADAPIELDPHVSFFVGDNGSGKSTLIEALAVASKLNPEGGGRLQMSLGFSTRRSHSELHKALVVERADVRPVNAFFLRAESFFNYATFSEAKRMEHVYERELHEQSHGESFLSLVLERFGPGGLYILDEPEAALSVHGQLALMRRMSELVALGSQFVVATHSPILLGYPGAAIFEFSDSGIARIAYEESDPYRLTKGFLDDPAVFLHHLLDEQD
jgi:predicted ATPase